MWDWHCKLDPLPRPSPLRKGRGGIVGSSVATRGLPVTTSGNKCLLNQGLLADIALERE